MRTILCLELIWKWKLSILWKSDEYCFILLSPFICHLPPSPCCKVPKCISQEVIRNYLGFIFRLDYFQMTWHRESQVIQQTAEKTGQFCQLTTFPHTKVRLSGFVQFFSVPIYMSKCLNISMSHMFPNIICTHLCSLVDLIFQLCISDLFVRLTISVPQYLFWCPLLCCCMCNLLLHFWCL